MDALRFAMLGESAKAGAGKFRNMVQSQGRMVRVFTLCEFIRLRRIIPILHQSVRGVLLFFALACLYPIHAFSAPTADYAREIRELAQAGDAEAQFALAQILDLGSGPTQDREEAITWLRKAAEQGLAAACFTLGLKYEFGATVGKDRTQAAAWYRRAALQDLPMAQYRLGLLHLPDDGPKPEPIPAFAWLALAAEHGYPDAAEDRDRAAGLLTPEERARAKAMREELRRQINQQRKRQQ